MQYVSLYFQSTLFTVSRMLVPSIVCVSDQLLSDSQSNIGNDCYAPTMRDMGFQISFVATVTAFVFLIKLSV